MRKWRESLLLKMTCCLACLACFALSAAAEQQLTLKPVKMPQGGNSSDISSPEFGVAGMDANKGAFPTWAANFGVLSGLGYNYGDFTKLVKEIARYSPVNLVSENCPPTICLYGSTGAVPTTKKFTYVAGKKRPYSDLWKMMDSGVAPPKSVGTDGIVAVQNYESLTNRLAAAKVPYAARIEQAPHCQILFRKPKTIPWLFENIRKYLK
jgi:hypothetical protein